MNYNNLIPELKKKRPFPKHSYNFKSEKYNYVYNESLDNITYWHASLAGLIYYETNYGTYGFTSWDYYSDSEEKCAKQVYNTIKKHLRKVTRENKRHDNGHYRKHLNWQNWLINYEKQDG